MKTARALPTMLRDYQQSEQKRTDRGDEYGTTGSSLHNGKAT